MKEKVQIDVCIATFKRPELLVKTLDSLMDQKLERIQMRIIVVDNDGLESARTTFDGYKSKALVPMIYAVEKEPGISAARNCLLDLVQADFFTFIDDDEVVSQGWLESLFETMEKYDADAVFGPVLHILPNDAPDWAKHTKIFQCKRRATGTVVKRGGTGNVLVRRFALGDPIQKFNLDYGLTGGEDTEFFYHLHLKGKRLVWSDDAEVLEPVPASRLSRTWVCQRKFRSGQAIGRIATVQCSVWSKTPRMARKGCKAIGTMFFLPIAFLWSDCLFVNQLGNLCKAMGELSVFFTKKYFREYDRKNYRLEDT